MVGLYGLRGVALITGAASGIGLDCAKSFADEGCVGIIFADLDRQKAEEAAKEGAFFCADSDCQTLALQVDVSDPASVEAMVAKTVEVFGRIDYCVHSAGVGARQPYSVLDMPVAELDRFHDVNERGTFNVIQCVGRQLMKQEPLVELTRKGEKLSQGSIVTLASCHSFAAAQNLAQYITSKHAVMGLTRAASLDLAKYGIRVNAVCPGWVDTPMVTGAVEANPEIGRYIERLVPFGRRATLEEISDVILFLSSPRASFVTGAGWVVDGGLTVGFPPS
ncbi:3-oxoacyl-[acyl-carrier-protein] reductase FabG [Cytospora mali]|uniref:3-oxoacyl-[acyl-carrier-protein] reductase FabG n=1 Tax=Cytospora mali TaxID=578113 RepID=A0A194W9S8_CYTMA|nr:3-oxoacyl-[acyl-carrier-protein] reductase FabG [Valsa mali]